MDLYDTPRKGASSPEENRGGRPFLGIYFECCNIYGRIYKNDRRRSYRGNCPHCGKVIEVPIGHHGEGTSQRFFRAP